MHYLLFLGRGLWVTRDWPRDADVWKAAPSIPGGWRLLSAHHPQGPATDTAGAEADVPAGTGSFLETEARSTQEGTGMSHALGSICQEVFFFPLRHGNISQGSGLNLICMGCLPGKKSVLGEVHSLNCLLSSILQSPY